MLLKNVLSTKLVINIKNIIDNAIDNKDTIAPKITKTKTIAVKMIISEHVINIIERITRTPFIII